MIFRYIASEYSFGIQLTVHTKPAAYLWPFKQTFTPSIVQWLGAFSFFLIYVHYINLNSLWNSDVLRHLMLLMMNYWPSVWEAFEV